MNSAPKYIWLQDGGDYDAAMSSGVDLTWCQDKVDDADTRYVRADLVPNDARNKVLRDALVSFVYAYRDANPMRTAEMHKDECKCLRCAHDAAASLLSLPS